MVDSSCLIQAASPLHPHNAAALAEIEARLAEGHELVFAGPSLAETYSVLTRITGGVRLSPANAARVIESWVEQGTVAALPAEAYRRLHERASHAAVAGGRIYDAVIALTAEFAGVDELLTFDIRDFTGISRVPVVVVRP
jgi:predicted nucleic acid-binding protein